MRDSYERRAYQRSGGFHCLARVSRDGTEWSEADVFDLSSGGIGFQTAKEYEIGETLMFELTVTGFLTEFEIKVPGIVRRAHSQEFNTYGVSFENLGQDLQIRIDEAVSNFRPKDVWY